MQWTYDTGELGHALSRAIVDEGKKNWFFIAADYAFGHDLEKQASQAVLEGGGKVLGVVDAPIGTSDFSSYLLQAQSANPDVVALANAGADLSNSIKQAAEFGLTQKRRWQRLS